MGDGGVQVTSRDVSIQITALSGLPSTLSEQQIQFKYLSSWQVVTPVFFLFIHPPPPHCLYRLHSTKAVLPNQISNTHLTLWGMVFKMLNTWIRVFTQFQQSYLASWMQAMLIVLIYLHKRNTDTYFRKGDKFKRYLFKEYENI